MGRMKAGADLHRDAHGHGQQDATLGRCFLHQDVERFTVDPLHHEIQNTVLLAEIHDLGDVRVADPGGEGGLVEEHLLELRIFHHFGPHGLDGDQLLETARTFEARDPDHGHAARSDRHQQLVSP